jgi:hypothetical protein
MKKLLAVSSGGPRAVTLTRTGLFRLFATALVASLWIVTLPAALSPLMTPTEMIEQGLPPGKTTQSATRTEFIFAVCAAVKKHRRDAPAIVKAAVTAHREYAGDIVETIIRCAFPDEEADCQFVGAIVAAAVAALPDSSSGVAEGALAAGPSCVDAIQAALRQGKNEEGNFGTNPPSSVSASPGSVSGGGGGFNLQEQPILVCDNGTQQQVLQSQLGAFLSSHPGSFVGSCQAPQGSVKQMMTSSGKEVMTSSGKEVMTSSGKEVMTSSGKEVMTSSGKEMMTSSGKEVMPEFGKESAANLPTGNFSRSPFHVSVAVREGYDDNVYTTHSDTVDSFFTNGSVTFDYDFDSPRTRLDLRAVGGLTYYYDHPFGQEYDVNTSLSLGLNHRATSRLILGVSAYLAYQSEPDFTYTLGVNRRSGNFFYTADKFSLAYQWTPRFSTVTSYTLGVINYDNSAVSAYEDRFEHTFGNEFRFLILPTTTLVAEYRYQIVDFDDSPRDSTTNFILTGLDHSFNRRFNVSLRAGAEFRDIDNFGERTEPYGEATLRYALDHRTSLNWTSRYGLEEPDVPGNPSRTTFRTGFSLGYAIAPRITSSLALFYEHDDNEGISTPTFIVPPFTEDSIDIGLGIRYEINRVFAVLAGYDHTQVLSDIALREYARNRYYLGLNATF